MTLPPLVMYIIHQYGLRGSFLIYGGIFLNCAVGGALVRPFKGANSKIEPSESADADETDSGLLTDLSTTKVLHTRSNEENAEPTGLSPAQSGDSVKNVECPKDQGESGILRFGSVPPENRNEHHAGDQGPPLNALASPQEEGFSQTYEALENSSDEGVEKGLQDCRNPCLGIGNREQVDNDSESECSDAVHGGSTELICSDMTDQGVYRSHASLHCIDGSMYLSPGRHCPDAKKAKSSGRKNKLFFAFRYFIDFTLFRNARYMFFLLSTCFSMVAFVNLTIYLIPRAEECGISRDKAALFLTITGGCDIFGRLILGVISDLRTIGPDRVMMIGLCLMGIATLLLPLARTFNTMTVYMVIFGLIGSSGHILSLPIVMKFVEEERMPRAMGLVVSFHGISNVVSPPVLGKSFLSF